VEQNRALPIISLDHSGWALGFVWEGWNRETCASLSPKLFYIALAAIRLLRCRGFPFAWSNLGNCKRENQLVAICARREPIVCFVLVVILGFYLVSGSLDGPRDCFMFMGLGPRYSAPELRRSVDGSRW